jgi:hypothetical protein
MFTLNTLHVFLQIFSFAYATGFDRKNIEAAKQMLTTFVTLVSNTFPGIIAASYWDFQKGF